jgi:hypothetical protein
VKRWTPESILAEAVEKPRKRAVLFRLADVISWWLTLEEEHAEALRYWDCARAIGEMDRGR